MESSPSPTIQAKYDLLNALQDDTCHSIGLFGERGSGKTALVKAEIPEYRKIFDAVVFVTVKPLDIWKLQHQIALQFRINMESVKKQSARASVIHSAIKSKNKALVIFDDVSTGTADFNLQNIGIPNPSMKCKILLITHDKNFCNMMRYYYWIPMHPLQSFPSGNFGYYFNTTKEASQKLLEALNDDSCYVIGLYGKKGSGKTSLVRAEIDKYKMIFDNVLFPTVSKNQDISSIQEGIANKLDNVHFERDDSDRVRLMKTNSAFDAMDGTTLVILDDFPTIYKPQELGIPYGGKQCKVLLTTRDEADCISMECDRSIFLKPLSDDEAWVLLQKLSGVNYRSTLLDVAQKVAFKCNGLPGLIKEVTSSLKKKSALEWEESLVSLSHSTARYQIFISFRGMDTRDDFTKPLYQGLCREGFVTFKDDESLEGGSPIEKLLDDIEESRFAIIILSKNYAESEWCLKELSKILECKDQEGKNQLVLPIFYEVTPTEVRHVINRYADAMAKHEKNGIDSKTIQAWKKALFDVCTLTGFEKPSDWTRDQFIGKIVNFACEHKHRLHIQSKYMN
ncbi:probable disease resistance protein At1g62630 [Lotus japonicus]|uniref:probable disease resistance protein At1g62630 n=1 Tax=Lotus japonicus TaxID=34305 RepID=UPI002583E774|nr:probable disease resistance protein At1g62630 [Lotus japonicus]